MTADEPRMLTPSPPVRLCSSHVPCGEKENRNYLGAAFHIHLASFVLLNTIPCAPVEPSTTLARIFTVFTNLFIPTLHSRIMAGFLMLRLSNHKFIFGSVCVCAALSILLWCSWFATTHSHMKFELFVLYF